MISNNNKLTCISITMCFFILTIWSSATAFAPSSGLTFSRTFDFVSHMSIYADIESGCTTVDKYGPNDCYWPWGSNVTESIAINITRNITADWKLNAKLKIDNTLDVNILCAACGSPCVIKIYGWKDTIHMPDCPVDVSKSIFGSMILPKSSPLPGTSITGSLTLGDNHNAIVAKLEFTMKS